MVWIPDLTSIPAEDAGGGGGIRSLEFAAEVELPEEQAVPPAPVETPSQDQQSPRESEPEPQPPDLNSPIPALASTDDVLKALSESLAALPVAFNSGAASQAGTDPDDAVLLGGSGHGPGEGGGSGGGVYRPGAGVRVPVPLREVRPRYTAEAMLARVEGSVLLEAVVLPDGTVGEIRIVRSFDLVSGQDFGLDQEAVNAVRQWQFKPGSRFGQPVAVLVRLTVTFSLR
jgi:TonB family protein